MNWNQLRSHLDTIKWDRYIPKAWSDKSPIEVHTVSNASVLYHTGAITERVNQYFNEVHRTKKLKNEVPVPRLFTRVHNNKVMFSAEVMDSMHMRFSMDPLASKDANIDEAKDRQRLLAIKANRAVAEEEPVKLDAVELPKPENTKYSVFTRDPMLLSSDEGYLVKPKWMSIAPMRETTAAALLMETQWSFLQTNLDPQSNSEAKHNQEEEITVWDPFCGSGTFLLEAAQMFIRSQTSGLFPPIHFAERRIGFKYWPTFDEKAYHSFINKRQQALQDLLRSRRNNNQVALSKKFAGPKLRLVGSDINKYCVAMSQINTQSMKKMVCSHFDGEMRDLVSEWMDSKVSFEYIASDFQFIDRYTTFNWPKTHIIANPPWGHRLGDSSVSLPVIALKTISNRSRRCYIKYSRDLCGCWSNERS